MKTGMKPNIALLALLGFLNLAFIGIALTPWFVPSRNFITEEMQPPRLNHQPAMPALSTFETIPLSEFRTMIERPLFIATRRLPNASAQYQGQNLILDRYAVIAIVVTTTQRLAYLKPFPGGQTFTVSQGDALGAWTVAAIERDRLELTSGNKRKNYVIRGIKVQTTD